MNASARRQAGRRAPHRVLPVRRRHAYAGSGRPHVAANDNPLPARPRRLKKTGWALPFAIVLVAVAALAFA